MRKRPEGPTGNGRALGGSEAGAQKEKTPSVPTSASHALPNLSA